MNRLGWLVAALSVPVSARAEPPPLESFTRDFVASVVPRRSGPYSLQLGGFSVSNLRVHALLEADALTLTSLSPDKVRAEGTVKVRVNRSEMPFSVGLDLWVWEGDCNAWLAPITIPVAVEIAVIRTDGKLDGSTTVLGSPFDGLPVSENLSTCVGSQVTAPLAAAGLAWARSQQTQLAASFERRLDARLAALTPEEQAALLP